MRYAVILLVILAVPIPASAATFKVPSQYLTIQDAIDAASGGDIVLVAPGTYVENIDFKGKAITVTSEQGTAYTIIDGNQAGSVVTCQNGEKLDSVLEGFTLTNGDGTELFPFYTYGGGILCLEGSTPLISRNVVIHNSAIYGGGLYCHKASPSIMNSLFIKNSVYYSGAGILCSRSSSDITNVTVVGNSGNAFGAGLYCVTDSDVTVTNSIFFSNSAPNGPQIAVRMTTFPSVVTIEHSDVQDGQGLVYLDPGCSINWGPGMIDSDPLFVDPGNGDFHLTFNSPCRASGENTAVTELYDFEGDPRIAYGTVDMGADEFYTHLYWTGDATPGGNVEIKFVGLPGTTPVGLCIGTGILEPPIPSIWGDWYLQFPIIGPVDLGKIPSPDGVLIIPGSIPGSPPPPYSIPMQALIGAELSNLSVLEVK